MKKTGFVALVGGAWILASVYMTPLMAFSVGAGATFGAAHMEALVSEGGVQSETELKQQSGTQDTQTVIASAYAQIIVGESKFGDGNGFVLGIEHVFGEGNFKKDIAAKTDNDANVVGVTTQGVQHAEGIIKNLNTVFIETPGFTPAGIYLMVGRSEADIVSKEDLITGGVYGDASTDGTAIGMGFKKSAGGFQLKTEFRYTEWDKITLTNTGSTNGPTSVSATPEAWSASMAIGYNF